MCKIIRAYFTGFIAGFKSVQDALADNYARVKKDDLPGGGDDLKNGCT